jgi:RNA-directed DNA polymerase
MKQRAVLRPYLDGLELLLKTTFPQRSGKLVNLVRFADDFVITGRTKEILEKEVKPLITTYLKERGLQLSESKTRITHINDGFDFLGTHIRKYNGKCLTKPSRSNVRAFLTEIKTTFRENLHTPVDKLIRLLNPKIRGWALFHRSSASKETFNYVDHEIFCHLKRWMLRRHPGKSRTWCYKKYLTRVGSRGYVLQGNYLDRRGRPHLIRLVNASDIPIKRHIKVKAAANPYDSNWEPYFEERLALHMKDSHQGYERLVKLWFDQNGVCPQCSQKITSETGWHLHHRIWVVNGGDDSFSNLILMHPTCHQQLHAQIDKAIDHDCHTASA